MSQMFLFIYLYFKINTYLYKSLNTFQCTSIYTFHYIFREKCCNIFKLIKKDKNIQEKKSYFQDKTGTILLFHAL